MVCRSCAFSNARGSTRVAQGENGKTVIISDEGRFDPRSIPKRKWDEYQAEGGASARDDARTEISSVTGRQSMRTSMFVPTVDQRGRHSRMVDQQNFYDNAPRVPSIPSNEKKGTSPLVRESYIGDSFSTLAPPRIGGETLEMQETPIHPSQRFSRPMSSVVGSRPGSFIGVVPGLPSDDQLMAEIKKMLDSADLMNVTKKDVKSHLERVYGVPLDVRKEYINQCTEAVLSGRL
jgi:chitin synthase